MEFKNLISLALFFAFFISYTAKLCIQSYKEEFNPLVLGKKQSLKERKTIIIEQTVRGTTLLWGIVWVLESLFERQIHTYMQYLMNPQIFIGLSTSFIGLLFFIVAMTYMGKSWRVGIDKSHQAKLIYEGIYKFSRNPAFVGFDLMFLGMFFTFPDILTFFVMLINIVSLHLLILQEERHLKIVHGDEYRTYMTNTPRYFFIK